MSLEDQFPTIGIHSRSSIVQITPEKYGSTCYPLRGLGLLQESLISGSK